MIAQAPDSAFNGPMPLGDYFRDVYCALRPDSLSRAQCDVYQAAFSNLGKFLGRTATTADLTNETVSSLMLWLIGRGRSPATANTYRNAILAMWRFAAEQGHVDQLPDMSVIREFRNYDIEENRRERMTAVALPQPLSSEMTLQAFLLEYARGRNLPQQAIEQLRWAITSLDKIGFQPVRLDQLSDRLIDDWGRQRLHGGIGERTIRQERSMVARLWQAAFEMDLVAIPPGTPAVRNTRRGITKAAAAPPIPLSADSVFGEEMKIGRLISHFIDWQEGRVAEKRMHGTRFYLRDFAEHFGEMTIAQFRPGACARVDLWIKSHKGWNGCRASVVSRLKQLFSWGATGPRNSQGFYVSSPIVSMERPKDHKRVSFFTAEQVDAILRHGSEEFRTAFRALLATGCRPNEMGKLTAADVEDDKGELYWLVHHKNEHHTGNKRRIYLTYEAQQITREQMKAFPVGRLFRSSSRGRPDCLLSETYVNHALRKITRLPECEALGLDEHRTGHRSDGTPTRLYKYVAYTARHTFAVRYLTGFYKGMDGKSIILGYPEVAQYLGNSAAMVERVYGHLVEQRKFLSARLRGVPLGQIVARPTPRLTEGGAQ